MTPTIRLHDKDFRLYMSAADIAAAVQRLGRQITADYSGRRVLLVAVLNGSYMFASDLTREIALNDQEITFVKLASYEGTSSTGQIQELFGLREDVTGRDVVVLEDIVDTGQTCAKLVTMLQQKGAASVEIACLLLKPASLRVPLKVRYVGVEIPNDFVVGYGLDYDGYGRGLPDIYQAVG